MILFGSDIYQKSFENSNDAQYILDLNTSTYIAVNPAFCAITGYKKEEIEGRLRINDITPPEDYSLMRQILERRKKGVETERYLYRIKTKSGETKPIEVSVRKIFYEGRELIIGSWRDLSERIALERTLRERIRETATATNRIMALTEKIKSVPLVTTILLRTSSEDALIKNFCSELCAQQKFGLIGAGIYLKHNNHLKLHYKLNLKIPKIIDIRKNHPFIQSFESELTPDNLSETFTLVIKGKTESIGILHLKFDPKEKELLQVNPIARKGYIEVLKTIADILGLAIENLRLSNNLKELSIKDGLTGVYNRRYFDKIIEEEFKRAKRYHRQLALLFLDLDRFKMINDKHGHKQGDVILREFAALIDSHSRKIDIICRYGGDEFAMVLPETSLEGAVAKADHLADVTKSHAFTNLSNKKKPFHIKVSVGAAALTDKISNVDEMIVLADNALFAQKGIVKTTGT
jgi:diguanylate cyclase (GGDEF)-like protein/PAS domain S-box-containing protein